MRHDVQQLLIFASIIAFLVCFLSITRVAEVSAFCNCTRQLRSQYCCEVYRGFCCEFPRPKRSAGKFGYERPRVIHIDSEWEIREVGPTGGITAADLM